MSSRQLRGLGKGAIFAWIVLALIGVITQPGTAQILYGSMVGNVRDASEASIPEAEVTIRNLSTNQTRSSLTNETGAFSFATLTPDCLIGRNPA